MFFAYIIITCYLLAMLEVLRILYKLESTIPRNYVLLDDWTKLFITKKIEGNTTYLQLNESKVLLMFISAPLAILLYVAMGLSELLEYAIKQFKDL